MDARISVLVDPPQMGNRDASELTMPDWCAVLVYDLDQDMSVREVEITWVNSAGNCEHSKLGGTVEVANRGDAVRQCLLHDVGAKGSA